MTMKETKNAMTLAGEQSAEPYNGADKKTKETLETIFGKERFNPKYIMERVKTYEDACGVLGIPPVLNGFGLCICEECGRTANRHGLLSFCQYLSKHDIAYFKLRVIASALNEGWTQQFTGDSVYYFPWFCLYKNREEWEHMSEDWKETHPYHEIGDEYDTEYAGFASGGSTCSPRYLPVFFGSYICFKSEELAGYCGTQFADMWMDYFLPRKSDKNLANWEK